jgi:hypothetical protein
MQKFKRVGGGDDRLLSPMEQNEYTEMAYQMRLIRKCGTCLGFFKLGATIGKKQPDHDGDHFDRDTETTERERTTMSTSVFNKLTTDMCIRSLTPGRASSKGGMTTIIRVDSGC